MSKIAQLIQERTETIIQMTKFVESVPNNKILHAKTKLKLEEYKSRLLAIETRLKKVGKRYSIVKVHLLLKGFQRQEIYYTDVTVEDAELLAKEYCRVNGYKCLSYDTIVMNVGEPYILGTL